MEELLEDLAVVIVSALTAAAIVYGIYLTNS